MIGKIPEVNSLFTAASECETVWWIELDKARLVTNEVIEMLNTYSHYNEQFTKSAEFEMVDTYLSIALDYIDYSIDTIKAVSNYLYEEHRNSKDVEEVA